MPEAPGTSPAYRDAGVDLDAADRFKAGLGERVASTFSEAVLGTLGGFGGCFSLEGITEEDPVLVASADGVGTKVVLARQYGRHDTVGEDLVNHCVDDLLAQGARPLFFLDYIATAALEPGVTDAVIDGFVRGCLANAVSLLGGETAEMPDVYQAGAYDLAGFIVGVAPRRRLERLGSCAAGDVVVGLASTGLHTNGYTLARHVVGRSGVDLRDETTWGGETWGDALLAVHRSYGALMIPLLDDLDVHAIAHITGGGFAGNLPRALPTGLGACLNRTSWPVPPIFDWLSAAGTIDEEEMYRVFNMGVGMGVIVAPGSVDRIVSRACSAGVQAWPIGSIEQGEGVSWE